MQTFRAFYEDATKTEAAARAEGYNGQDGSLMDYVDPHDYRTGKDFKFLAEAERWLKNEISAGKTVFGAGTIYAREEVKRRCRYCTCGGVRDLHEYTVEDEGIVADEACDDDCLN